MTIIVKNKETLFFNDFTFKCAIGKKGKTKNKVEGDKKTPQGHFSLGNLYYRRDRNYKPKTKIKCIPIKKNMGWCDDPKDSKNYNKLIKIKSKIKCEKIYRKDNKYDFLLPINYNKKKTVLGKGSAIFIHLTSNYNGTLGCITLKKKDFLILLKLIKEKTKIRIY